MDLDTPFLQTASRVTMEIVDYLRRRRKSLGLTQGDVAEKLSLNISSVTRLENHDTNISLQRFLSLCSIYEINPTELLDEILNP